MSTKKIGRTSGDIKSQRETEDMDKNNSYHFTNTKPNGGLSHWDNIHVINSLCIDHAYQLP